MTVTAVLGDSFGGLGFFILEGYRRSFPFELYVGAFASILPRLRWSTQPAARLQRRMTPWARASSDRRRRPHERSSARPIAWLTDPVNWSGPNGIPVRLAEHVAHLGSLALAHRPRHRPADRAVHRPHRARRRLAINSANIWRALPSLAVIAIVLPITAAIDPQAGFKIYPTVIAMVVLAVPPILVNAYSGMQGVDRDLVEAGRGLGMNERQLLARVELPLAVAVILTGIRSGTVQIIATATLGAIFGFGGLGRYLVDGFAQRRRSARCSAASSSWPAW